MTKLIDLRWTLPFRMWRNRGSNAVWWHQQWRLRRRIARAFAVRREGAPMPTLRGHLPEATSKVPVVMSCCDQGYFERFGRDLAASASRRSPSTRFHLHVFDPSADCIASLAAMRAAAPTRFSFTHETGFRNRYGRPTSFYFAGGRFAPAAHIHQRIAAPIMLIDTDGLVHRDLSAAFAALAEVDVGMIKRPTQPANYRKVLACAVYFGRGERARLFSRSIAAAIGSSLRRAKPFHTDQITLHFAALHAERRQLATVVALDPRWSDYDFRPDGLIWTAKGGRKAALQASADAAIDDAA